MHSTLRGMGLALLLATLLSAAPGDEGFKPVAGVKPLLTATDRSLASARDWLAQKDLASLALAGPELDILVRLLAVQGSSEPWQKGTANLENLARQLSPACRSKDATRAREILTHFAEQLTALEQVPPGDAKTLPTFKAGGSVKSWMLAIDFTYNEAKAGKTAEKTADLARALAEQANAMQFLRADARWRTYSQQVRDHALAAADAAQNKKPDEAKQFLLKAFERCEACHQNKK